MAVTASCNSNVTLASAPVFRSLLACDASALCRAKSQTPLPLLLRDTSDAADPVFDVRRRDCEVTCDTQVDCNTLCECWDSCGDNSYCTCSICEALSPDAATDTQFFTIQNAAASSGAASASIIAGLGAGSGRKLLQSAADVTAQLAAVLTRVDTLKDAQAGTTGQLNALQSQVDKANLLAEARAASTTIQDLITGKGVMRGNCSEPGTWPDIPAPASGVCFRRIDGQTHLDSASLLQVYDCTSYCNTSCFNTSLFVLCAAGRADIQSGKQVLQSKLDLLLQRQQAAIDAMNAANSQLAALQVRAWHRGWCGATSAALMAAGCGDTSYVLPHGRY